MAQKNPHDAHDSSAMDYAEHERTFSLFAGLIKWGTVFSLGFVLLVGGLTGTLPWAFVLIVLALLVFIAARVF